MKKERIIQILYLLSATNFFIYLTTKKSGFLFCGGILSIVASVMLIISNLKK